MYSNTKWSERLNYLATIEAGWYEGYGEVIEPATLDKADEILNSLDSPNFNVPGIYPLVEDGGIGMEWSRHPQDSYLVSVEFTKAFQYVVFAMDTNDRSAKSDTYLETESYEEAMDCLRECLTKTKLLTNCVTRDEFLK